MVRYELQSFVSVFQEKPDIPPSQAQAAIHASSRQDYTYFQSILQMIKSVPFFLLIVTYGKLLLYSFITSPTQQPNCIEFSCRSSCLRLLFKSVFQVISTFKIEYSASTNFR